MYRYMKYCRRVYLLQMFSTDTHTRTAEWVIRIFLLGTCDVQVSQWQYVALRISQSAATNRMLLSFTLFRWLRRIEFQVAPSTPVSTVVVL